MKKLYLSSTDKKIAGLCGGIAEYYEADPNVIRFAWVLVTILTGIVPGIVAYIVGIIIVPSRDSSEA